MRTPTLGALLYAFFENHLKAHKGLRPATIRSYRDAVRLFLTFVAEDRRCRLTRVKVDDLTARRVGGRFDDDDVHGACPPDARRTRVASGRTHGTPPAGRPAPRLRLSGVLGPIN